MKRTQLKRGKRRTLTAESREQAYAFYRSARWLPCAMCGIDPVVGSDAHHVVEAQELRKRVGISGFDTRNSLPLCRDCHERHTNRSRPVPFRKLRAENIAYAYEVLGDYAGDYLKRYPMDETEEQA